MKCGQICEWNGWGQAVHCFKPGGNVCPMDNSNVARMAREASSGNRITYESRAAIYREAIKQYGVNAQKQMAIEEMSELIKEICKISRGKMNREDLADEIADVTIMLEQLRLMYGLNEEVCRHMDMKVERLACRLGAERDLVVTPAEDRLLRDVFKECDADGRAGGKTAAPAGE